VFLNGSTIALLQKQEDDANCGSFSQLQKLSCSRRFYVLKTWLLYVLRILNSIGLKVKLHMKLFVGNIGAKDLVLCHNWSVADAGRTRHGEVKQYFLRELKEAGIIVILWKR
jgi:hypothetical protein